MKMPKWLLSKWLHYGWLAIFLVSIGLYLLPLVVSGHGVAENLIAEIFGLLFTLVVFIIFFELREKTKWKAVEDKVRRRIGRQIHLIFIELSNLCEVNSMVEGVKVFDNEVWQEVEYRQLSDLTSKVPEIGDVGKEFLADANKRRGLASFLDSRRTYLSQIEDKYLKFLDSHLQESLMGIQDYLEGLHLELRVKRRKAEDSHQAIANLIGKIMEEIAQIRKSGTDIGF